MLTKEIPDTNREQLQALATSLHDFSVAYIANLRLLESQGECSTTGHADRVQKLLDYCDLTNPDTIAERIICSGPAMAILPPNPTAEEIRLATDLTSEGGQLILEYQNRFLLKSVPNLPIPTIFVRTNQEMVEFCRLPGYAGPISLTFNPIGSTFNLEAANYTLDKLGLEMGQEAVSFSKYHEDAHTVAIRHQLAICRQMGIPDLDQASTFRKISILNSTCWELAANELPHKLNVFPCQIAALGDPDPRIDIRIIIESGNIDHPDYESIMYPLIPDSPFEPPFVTLPECANVYLALENATQKYRETVDPNFYWTRYLADYLENHPLADVPLDMPPGFTAELLDK